MDSTDTLGSTAGEVFTVTLASSEAAALRARAADRGTSVEDALRDLVDAATEQHQLDRGAL